MPGLTGSLFGPGSRPVPMREALRDASIVLAACALIGAAVNGMRKDGIAFIQKTPYEILVPCPETLGDASAVPAEDPVLWGARTLLVDARSQEEYGWWHPPRAWSVPFDYLEPADPDAIRRMAASGAARVVVFGDGQDPDSGEQLAREISGRGIKNVGFIPGGAASLRGVMEKEGAP